MGDEGIEIRSQEEQEWAATELRNSLRSIEWDLEDLDDTVQIVEKNPAKFRIDANDLIARKNFIKLTKDEVEIMKQKSSVQNKNSVANRFSEVCSNMYIYFHLSYNFTINVQITHILTYLFLQGQIDAQQSFPSPTSQGSSGLVSKTNKYSRWGFIYL